MTGEEKEAAVYRALEGGKLTDQERAFLISDILPMEECDESREDLEALDDLRLADKVLQCWKDYIACMY